MNQLERKLTLLELFNADPYQVQMVMIELEDLYKTVMEARHEGI